MQKGKSRFTVFFEGPFWVGVYERVWDGKLEACKITFGAEPKEYEVYAFLLQRGDSLRFSPPVEAAGMREMKISPKRMQRAIKKQLAVRDAGTKAQQALQCQREEDKTFRKQRSRRQKEEEQQRRFEGRQQKKKEKHKGR